MTNENRVVLITSRFWPQMRSHGILTSYLAQAMLARGVHPTIVTPSWHSEWPTRLEHREIPVVRPAKTSMHFWGRFRFARAVSRWLKETEPDWFGVYLASLDAHAFLLLKSLCKAQKRVWVRISESNFRNFSSDLRRWVRARRLHGTGISPKWIADTEFVAQQLPLLGIAPETILQIPPGVPEMPERTAISRFEARAALARINQDLEVAEFAPVFVSVGEWDDLRGNVDLLEAWRGIAAAYPSACLWLIGDGSARSAIYEHAVDLGIHHQVRMPGTFDDMEDIWMAADAFVSPSGVESTRLATLEAMAAGLPIVAVESRVHRSYLDDGACGVLVAPNDPCMWTRQMQRLLDQPTFAATLAAAARERARSSFDIGRYAEWLLTDAP